MGQLDFEYGYNVPKADYSTSDPPTYLPARDDPHAGDDNQACMGMLVCPHCGKAAMCGDVQIGENNMIPREQESQGGNSQRRGRKSKGLRYLNADMLTSAHQLANIVAARVVDDTFNQGKKAVETKLKFKGEFILWTLRLNNPNTDVICDALGDDETAWGGRDIELYTETDDFNGRIQIRVDVVSLPREPSKRR